MRSQNMKSKILNHAIMGRQMFKKRSRHSDEYGVMSYRQVDSMIKSCEKLAAATSVSAVHDMMQRLQTLRRSDSVDARRGVSRDNILCAHCGAHCDTFVDCCSCTACGITAPLPLAQDTSEDIHSDPWRSKTRQPSFARTIGSAAPCEDRANRRDDAFSQLESLIQRAVPNIERVKTLYNTFAEAHFVSNTFHLAVACMLVDYMTDNLAPTRDDGLLLRCSCGVQVAGVAQRRHHLKHCSGIRHIALRPR
jgi:hypothetical protein